MPTPKQKKSTGKSNKKSIKVDPLAKKFTTKMLSVSYDIKNFNQILLDTVIDKVPNAPLFNGKEEREELLDKLELYQSAYNESDKRSYEIISDYLAYIDNLSDEEYEIFRNCLLSNISCPNN